MIKGTANVGNRPPDDEQCAEIVEQITRRMQRGEAVDPEAVCRNSRNTPTNCGSCYRRCG